MLYVPLEGGLIVSIKGGIIRLAIGVMGLIVV